MFVILDLSQVKMSTSKKPPGSFPGGFPGSIVVENPSANAGDTRDMGLIPWLRKIPWRRKWQPIPVFLPEIVHGERSLVGYSPWGHKESDMT